MKQKMKTSNIEKESNTSSEFRAKFFDEKTKKFNVVQIFGSEKEYNGFDEIISDRFMESMKKNLKSSDTPDMFSSFLGIDGKFYFSDKTEHTETVNILLKDIGIDAEDLVSNRIRRLEAFMEITGIVRITRPTFYTLYVHAIDAPNRTQKRSIKDAIIHYKVDSVDVTLPNCINEKMYKQSLMS